MQVAVTVTPKMVADLMITAVAGGINYWCSSAEITKAGTSASFQNLETFEDETWVAYFTPIEDAGKPPAPVTPDTLAAALAAHPTRFSAVLDETYDAFDADVIIQQAVFCDIVFG